MESKLEKIYEAMKKNNYSLNFRVSLTGKCIFDIVDKNDLLVSYLYCEDMVDAINRLYLRLVD